MSRTTETPLTSCPYCKAHLDRASDSSGAHPSEGDFTVCIYCGAGLVFRPDLTVRVPTTSELGAMQNDPLFRRAQRVVRDLAVRRN